MRSGSRLRDRRWIIGAVAAVVVVAAVIAVVVIAPWSSDSTQPQRVDVLAGGGASTAASGSARTLRLPLISAMAVAPNGVVWAAGETSSAPQIIEIRPGGRAVRAVVHTDDDNAIVSLAVAPDGTLWAVSGGGGDVAYRFVGGRLTPAFAPFDATKRYPADGSIVRSTDPQPGLTQLAFDGTGGLTFLSPASDDSCVTLRRIDSDGRISTLAGQDVTDSNANPPNDAPANGSDAHKLCLSLFDTFALLGRNAVVIRTRVATFLIDLSSGRTSSLSSVSKNSPTTPPVAGKPLQRSAPVTGLYLPQVYLGGNQMCGVGANDWFAVAPRSSRTDTEGHTATVSFPSSYDWRATSGPTPAVHPGRGDSQVLLRVDRGRAAIVTAAATGVACSTDAVYVSALTSGGAGVIARFPDGS